MHSVITEEKVSIVLSAKQLARNEELFASRKAERLSLPSPLVEEPVQIGDNQKSVYRLRYPDGDLSVLIPKSHILSKEHILIEKDRTYQVLSNQALEIRHLKGSMVLAEIQAQLSRKSAKEKNQKLEAPTPGRTTGKARRKSLCTGLNASCLLIGGSGSGKSFRYVAPNLLQANSSFVVTNPKGTLLEDYGSYLLIKGYQVKVININSPACSDAFNPFAYIHSNKDIVTLVNDYIRATTPKNSSEGEVFWKLAEAKLTAALIQLMFVAFPEDCTMERFLSLVGRLEPPSEGDTDSYLTELFQDHQEQETVIGEDDKTHQPVVITGQRAYENYMSIMNSAEDTCRSVIISVQTRYDSISNSPDLIRMLSGKDSVDFRSIGTGFGGKTQKTALFIVSSDIDKTFAGLVLWVQSSLFRELYAAADACSSGRLPIPVQIFLDEFANVPQGENILQLFATARSRFISITAIAQSQGQLKGLFKDEAETIQGSADTFIYMGSNEPSVHKAVAEQLGKYSIHKKSTSDAVGLSGSNTVNTDSIGKDLMSPDRIRMLPGDKEIVLIRGYDPVIDSKYRTETSREYLLAKSCGKYDHARMHAYDGMGFPTPFTLSPDNSHRFPKGPALPVFEFSSEELFSLPDAAFELSSEERPENLLIQSLKPLLLFERQQDQDAADTLEHRLAIYDYSEDQLTQASLALQEGISEQALLEWFMPDVSPASMEQLRKLSLRP